MQNEYEKVLELYLSEENSLKALAEKTPYDVFEFYRGANLRGLNLSGQDLSGMNFDGADLRFCKLDNVVFDAGAFNGSLLSPEQEWIKDQYEFYYDDIVDHPINEILIHCSFRPKIVEICLDVLNINYTNFSDMASVSSNALRKSRASGVIAHETAYKILTTIREMANQLPDGGKAYILSVFKQPFVQFLSGGINMPFKGISRARMKNLIDMRKEIVEIHKEKKGEDAHELWRNTPESLEWMLRYYRTYRTE